MSITSKPPADPKLAKQMQGRPRPQEEQEETDESGISQRFLLFQVMPSWLTSFIFHIIVIIVLALIPILLQKKRIVDIYSGEASTAVETPSPVNFDALEMNTEELEAETDEEVTEENFEQQVQETPMVEQLEETNLDAKIELLPQADFGQKMSEIANAKADVSSRSNRLRKYLVKKHGGTPASENAVQLGLKWLAAHQLKNGSWSFDHTKAGPNKSSKNPGRIQAPRAATGMALMAFLGAGQTHRNGDYKETVRRGLAYLINTQKAESNGAGSFMEPSGSMYSHGIASIALTEAWSMTRDEKLRVPAQAAINFIVYAQHSEGGWRYVPKQAGDTSVVGWQVMALKSANMASLRVPKKTMRGVENFLDSVSEESGAYYGYTSPAKGRKTLTAVGLLCRMYMGWKREHPALERGVDFLSDRGPAIDDRGQRATWNMYYNYYATQVLKQYGGDKWKKWNEVMREELIKTQDQKGQEKGSWYFKSDWHGSHGGRVYCTTLAVMTLEVYYRYLPLYDQKVQEDEFEF